jgi:hypothetical protein
MVRLSTFRLIFTSQKGAQARSNGLLLNVIYRGLDVRLLEPRSGGPIRNVHRLSSHTHDLVIIRGCLGT